MYKIGIFDSGIGGLTVLNEITKLLPNEDILYYGDSKNNPYGNKSDEELLNITKRIVEYFINYECKIIVIACNTATTRCIHHLRKMYPDIIFVGTEPAIKVACDHHSKSTLVLGTKATVTSASVQKLIHENKRENQTIYLENCEGLAHAIEMQDEYTIHKILEEHLLPYQDKEIDAVVLGCTHYPYVGEEILKYFKNATIYDGSIGVAKEVKRQLENHHLKKTKQTLGNVKIIDSIEKLN